MDFVKICSIQINLQKNKKLHLKGKIKVTQVSLLDSLCSASQYNLFLPKFPTPHYLFERLEVYHLSHDITTEAYTLLEYRYTYMGVQSLLIFIHRA